MDIDRLNTINPALAVSFSGHRPDRLPGKGDPDAPETKPLIAALRERIEDAIRRGKIFYLHGGMAGFDIVAAEQVVEAKKQYPQIRLVTVSPYETDLFSREKCWTPEWVNRAREVFARHDMGVNIAGEYRRGIYYERNRVLVRHSSELICYHDGNRGGTKYTRNTAVNKGLAVYNLFGK